MCTSIYFLALSHAPPLLEADMAICTRQRGSNKRHVTQKHHGTPIRCHTYLDTGNQCAGEQSRERADSEEGAGDQRREQHQRSGRHHLHERRVRGDPDAAGVVRRGAALHQPRDGDELPADLLHHLQRCAAHASSSSPRTSTGASPPREGRRTPSG